MGAAASVLPQGVEIGEPGTGPAFDPVAPFGIDELAGVAPDEKEPGGSELARDEAREIGAHVWEMARVHGSTL